VEGRADYRQSGEVEHRARLACTRNQRVEEMDRLVELVADQERVTGRSCRPAPLVIVHGAEGVLRVRDRAVTASAARGLVVGPKTKQNPRALPFGDVELKRVQQPARVLEARCESCCGGHERCLETPSKVIRVRPLDERLLDFAHTLLVAAGPVERPAQLKLRPGAALGVVDELDRLPEVVDDRC
jgi:hypothetical protein